MNRFPAPEGVFYCDLVLRCFARSPFDSKYIWHVEQLNAQLWIPAVNSEAPAKSSLRSSVGEATRQQGIDIRSAGHGLGV